MDFDDSKIQFLKSINEKISKLDIAKILNIPENKKVLQDLVTPFNMKNNMNKKEGNNPGKV